MIRVLVLGGGPDAEREVSLISSKCVAAAISKAPGLEANYQIIGRVTARELRGFQGDVVFPVLHGGFVEGGPLQDLLEGDGRPYVGCGSAAARLAMDKVATKLVAASAGIAVIPGGVFDGRDSVCPVGLPAVLKPVHDGSSVGVHLCRDALAWERARAAVMQDMESNRGRVYMLERLIEGKELTVGVLDPGGTEERALAPIEIRPAVEFYDYEAKYNRDDTQYIVDPALPPGVKARIQEWALCLVRAGGVRHLARVDFLLDGDGGPRLLEMNTMPGFTDHSLVPMAARAAGLDMPHLCASLVRWAVRDGVK